MASTLTGGNAKRGSQKTALISSVDSGKLAPASPKVSSGSRAEMMRVSSSDLRAEVNALVGTLTQCGFLVPQADAEKMPAEGAGQQGNILLSIEDYAFPVIRMARTYLEQAVYGQNACLEDEAAAQKDAPVDGNLFDTDLGASLYSRTKDAIRGLTTIQRLVARVQSSVFGTDQDSVDRPTTTGVSILESLDLIHGHMDDTISAVSRLNVDLRTNLLGDLS